MDESDEDIQRIAQQATAAARSPGSSRASSPSSSSSSQPSQAQAQPQQPPQAQVQQQQQSPQQQAATAKQQAAAAKNAAAGGSQAVVPWGEFFKSPPVWAVTVAHFCFNWGYYTLLAWLPSYFEMVRAGLA
jgi:hypothetical protein